MLCVSIAPPFQASKHSCSYLISRAVAFSCHAPPFSLWQVGTGWFSLCSENGVSPESHKQRSLIYLSLWHGLSTASCTVAAQGLHEITACPSCVLGRGKLKLPAPLCVEAHLKSSLPGGHAAVRLLCDWGYSEKKATGTTFLIFLASQVPLRVLRLNTILGRRLLE